MNIIGNEIHSFGNMDKLSYLEKSLLNKWTKYYNEERYRSMFVKKIRSEIISCLMLFAIVFLGVSNSCVFADESFSAENKKITVVGIGYVGLANSILLAQNNEVIALDIVKEKVDMVNNRISPLVDKEIEDYLKNRNLNLIATTDENLAYKDADYIVIATPTDYNVEKEFFDTSSVEKVISRARQFNPTATIIIKSTIPIGYTKEIREKFNCDNIIFSPEFLREGKALYDNLYPSRIIIGCDLSNEKLKKSAENFANLLKQGAIKKDVTILLTDFTEAEAIKLFSNAYLAMRVAYFNELDTYGIAKGLNTQQIIDGVGLDSRIGSHYNNPSFGYGGYCFPKDTKQLLANFKNIPNDIITAIVDANETRKEFIAEDIYKKSPKVVGIYKLAMKSGSDNFRQSAIIDVMKKLNDKGIEVVIYEPEIKNDKFMGFDVIKDMDEFKKVSDIVVTNRFEQDLSDIMDKVYTRDIYSRD